jgi:hypothetical protein
VETLISLIEKEAQDGGDKKRDAEAEAEADGSAQKKVKVEAEGVTA